MWSTFLERIAVAVACITIASSTAQAACDFATHKYRDELARPSEIDHISVEIKNSRKWFKNSISIITSRKTAIDETFKDKLKAKLTVHYSFGTCVYPARVRQNGDLKDHIKLMPGGNIISSIDVKLEKGNILNAVRFKLLLPETRGGLNEVLGALVLRELGYIAPETFLVPTDINGVQSVMLFQENAVKELLERNFRREGPIFEGDESIIWNIDGFEDSELVDISLARQTNDKWAQKGATSTKISLDAFEKLQAAYISFAASSDRAHYFFSKKLVPTPGSGQASFDDYALVILAMYGQHALYSNNRKFYFNSFTQAFEPIYYDGNLDILGRWGEIPGVLEAKEYSWQFASPNILAQSADRIANLQKSPSFRQKFLERAGARKVNAEILFNDGLDILIPSETIFDSI